MKKTLYISDKGWITYFMFSSINNLMYILPEKFIISYFPLIRPVYIFNVKQEIFCKKLYSKYPNIFYCNFDFYRNKKHKNMIIVKDYCRTFYIYWPIYNNEVKNICILFPPIVFIKFQINNYSRKNCGSGHQYWPLKYTC